MSLLLLFPGLGTTTVVVARIEIIDISEVITGSLDIKKSIVSLIEVDETVTGHFDIECQ